VAIWHRVQHPLSHPADQSSPNSRSAMKAIDGHSPETPPEVT
jgi:hypothetical protein